MFCVQTQPVATIVPDSEIAAAVQSTCRGHASRLANGDASSFAGAFHRVGIV